MRLESHVVPRFAFATVLLLSAALPLRAQSDHDRYIHQQSEYNTRYFNNADNYPAKTDNAALAAKIAAGFGSKPRVSETPRYSAPAATYGAPVSSGPSESQLRVAKEQADFKQFHDEFLRGDNTHLTELGTAYYAGRGTDKNLEIAYALYRAAADKSPIAAFASASMIFDGVGVAKNEEIGVEAMRDAARLHSPTAEAWLKQHGYRVPVDPALFAGPDAALEGARKALSVATASGTNTGAGLTEAVAVMRSKAEAGDPQAQFYLASALERGTGVAKNPAEAFKWFKESADNRNVFALYRMGIIKWNGELGQQRYDHVGSHYLMEAKDLGSARALYAFGQAFSTGDHSLPLDKKAAVDFYQAAADKGFAPAEAALAKCYYDGFGVPKDDLKADSWARKVYATEPLAAMIMAKLYATGATGTKDAAASLKLMQAAAKGREPEAVEAMARGFDGTSVQTSGAQLGKDAYAQLPPLLERQMEYYRKQHASLKTMSAKDRESGKKRFQQARTGCQSEPHLAMKLGLAYMLTNDPANVDEANTFFYCATLQKVPGALEELMWTSYLKFYPLRHADAEHQKVGREFFQGLVNQQTNQNPLAAYLRAGLDAWDKQPSTERASLLIALAGGIREAEVDLAAMEWEGTGGPMDNASGTRYMLEAAKTDPAAMYLLGFAYANGLHGLTTDKVAGTEMMTKAATLGFHPVKDLRETSVAVK